MVSGNGSVPSLICNENVPLKHPMPEKNVALQFFCHFGTYYHVPFNFLAMQENNLFPGYLCYQVAEIFFFKLLFILDLSCLDCSFICPLLLPASIVLLLILSSCNF